MTERNGTIWVAYSKWQTSGQLYNIDYKTFNGAWSSERPLTTVNIATFGDTHPDLVQDRNGTIWLFWARELKLGTNAYEDQLFYKFSGDGGSTWTSDNQLLSEGNATLTIDDTQPSAVQAKDRSLWIFYASDATGLGSAFDIYYIKTNPIYPVHDLAVTGIQASALVTYPYGDAPRPLTTLNVTVADIGDFIENIQVRVQAVNSSIFNIGSSSAFIASGQTHLFTFTWNTTGAPPARYTIVATVTPPPGETVGAAQDDSLRYKAVMVPLKGDINMDGKVNIFDASIMGFAFGSTPTSPNWNPNCDLVLNGKIDIFDFAVLGGNYQKNL
jgi:hypothetical protein